MKHLARILRAAREEAGMSQQGLADLAGVSVRLVSDLETGRQINPTIDSLSRICEVLGIAELPVLDNLSFAGRVSRLGVTPFDVIDVNPRFVTLKIEFEVSAGMGGLAEPEGDEMVAIPDFLVGPETAVLRARGDSMVDEGIEDGDLLVVERRPGGVAANNELVIAWFNDGLVVKRWTRRQGKKFLVSANPAYRPQEIREGDTFELQGVVRHIMKTARRIS